MSGNEYRDNEIVMSSRIRLARNVMGVNFPILISQEKGKDIVDRVGNSIESHKLLYSKIENKDLSTNDRRKLVEKHLTSPEWGARNNAAVFISIDEKVSIMVNEEDHIRIQCILDGFRLNEAYEMANGIDDLLEENIRFAFDEKYGYLTACPTNVGTGMRASVMLHLPALTLNNQMSNLLQTLARFGVTIRGIYGEGSQGMGDLYQISNQLTLGYTEGNIIKNIHSVAKEIIKKERNLRKLVLETNRTYLEDKVFRALGVLSNAREISLKESMKLLSLVRLGTDLHLVDQDIKTINTLMNTIQPGILYDIYGESVTEENEINKLRADHIRKELENNIT